MTTMERATETNAQWIGPNHADSVDAVSEPSETMLLQHAPLDLDSASSGFRIGCAQSFFKPDNSGIVRPTASEQELMRSLPYQ